MISDDVKNSNGFDEEDLIIQNENKSETADKKSVPEEKTASKGKNESELASKSDLKPDSDLKSETVKESEPELKYRHGEKESGKENESENKKKFREKSKGKSSEEEMKQLGQKLEDKVKQYEEVFDRLQRTAAEFENYKKRTQKEKENIYNDAAIDIVRTFLPVVDSIDRAVEACSNDSKDNEKDECIKSGIELVKKQISDILKKLDVEEIQSVGKNFNPEYHNAVMHIEDDSVEQNMVVEEFEKGYIMKEKVIRYSMVKVAN
jgi:molecular chaperone GrpE